MLDLTKKVYRKFVIMKYDQIYNNREDTFIYIKIRDFLAFP